MYVHVRRLDDNVCTAHITALKENVIKNGDITINAHMLGCEITACQKTFSGQKHCLSGHTDICMEKMPGQSFSKLKQQLLETDK